MTDIKTERTQTNTENITPETVKKLPPPPQLPFTMKAHLAEYRSRIGVLRIVLAVGLSFIIFLRFGFVAWIASVIAIVVILFTIFYFMSHRRITASNEGLEYVNGLGKRRSIAYSEIQDSKVFLNFVEPTFGVAPRIIIGKKDAPFVSVYGLYWKVDDMNLLLSLLEEKKVRFDTYKDMAVSAMIAKQFPQSVAVHERHPYWIAMAIVAGIIVLVTIAVLLSESF